MNRTLHVYLTRGSGKPTAITYRYSGSRSPLADFGAATIVRNAVSAFQQASARGGITLDLIEYTRRELSLWHITIENVTTP